MLRNAPTSARSIPSARALRGTLFASISPSEKDDVGRYKDDADNEKTFRCHLFRMGRPLTFCLLDI